MKVKVSIITVNYNHSKLLIDFLQSFKEFFPSDVLDYQIIIVDNASEEDDYNNLISVIKKSDIEVVLKRSRLNLGFGGGNMFGVQFSDGDYYAFINNDVVFVEDCFSYLVNYLEENADTAIVSPQQLSFKKEPSIGFDYIQGIRKELFGRSFIEFFNKEGIPKRKSLPYNKPFKVPAIQGCFMFCDAQKFDEIGGFDSNLFLYFEEMDLCYRMTKRGYSSVLLPQKSFIHLEGMSIDKNKNNDRNFLIKRELLISRLYVYQKHYSFFKYKTLQFILFVKLLGKSLFSVSNLKLMFIVLRGTPLKYSLKQIQQISKFRA